jgi:hypothetical protein
MALGDEKGTTVGDVLKSAGNLVTGGFTGLAAGEAYKAVGPDKDIPEADPQAGDTVQEAPGSGERIPSRSGRKPVQSPVDPDPPKTGGKSRYTAVSTIKPGGTPSERELYAEKQANIERSERATRIAEMKVQGYAEQEMIDYANISSMDAEEGRRLHREHFSVAKQKQDQLYSRVQAARTMQVDPFNWHKSIGRGGRVASAFSMLTGQIAAGAGNPSSAMKMMDAAINRDIAAQETNIKNEYDNLKLVKGLNENDRALYMEELGSLNETRAVRYAAMLAKLEAAKQHAINESAYNSYKVMGDHYTMKLLESLWAARAEILTVHGKGPIQQSKLRMLNAQIAGIQKELTDPYIQAELAGRGEEAAGALQAGATQATTGAAEPSLAPAPGRAGAVGGRRAAPAPTEGTPPGKARPSEAAPAPATERATPEPIEDEAAGMSRMETQKEADERATTAAEFVAQEEQIMGRKAVNPRQLGKQAMVRGYVEEDELNAMLKQGGANDYVIKHNGYGKAEAAAAGDVTWGILTLTPAINSYVAGKPFTMNDGVVDGFSHVSDAKAFAEMVPPPRRSTYRNATDWSEAHRQWEYNKNHYEVYEAPGMQNSFEAGGRGFRLKGTSTARNQDARGEAKYDLIAGKVQESFEFVAKLKDTAANIRRVGIGSGGWFNADEGAFSIPGFNSLDVGTKELTNTSLKLAMGFIKSEDPTARLSDNDVKIGEKAMAIMMQGKAVTIMDIIQGLDGDWDNNTVRLAMDRYMQKLALNAEKAIIQKYQNDIVLDYNSSIKFREESNATQVWLNTTPGWARRGVTE